MLSNLCLPSGHQCDTSTSEYWSGKVLTSTILRDLVETGDGSQKNEESSSVVGTVVPVVVVVLVVVIVGAIAGVIFWRR